MKKKVKMLRLKFKFLSRAFGNRILFYVIIL